MQNMQILLPTLLYSWNKNEINNNHNNQINEVLSQQKNSWLLYIIIWPEK